MSERLPQKDTGLSDLLNKYKDPGFRRRQREGGLALLEKFRLSRPTIELVRICYVREQLAQDSSPQGILTMTDLPHVITGLVESVMEQARLINIDMRLELITTVELLDMAVSLNESSDYEEDGLSIDQIDNLIDPLRDMLRFALEYVQ